MGKYSKPISGIELHRFLTDMGCDIRQPPGKRPVAVVLGTEVRIPFDDKKSFVDFDTLARLARALGCTRQELEATLGRSQVKGGKSKAQPPATEESGPSKADTVRLVAELLLAAKRLDAWIERGTHGRALYIRVHGAVSEALSALAGYPPHNDRDLEAATYQRLSPDDKGYRPTTPDSITTGVGRATGLTATAAKRGRTYTAWEIKEREKRGAS